MHERTQKLCLTWPWFTSVQRS